MWEAERLHYLLDLDEALDKERLMQRERGQKVATR